MAHYALLDENNVVTNVIVGNDEGFEGKDWEQIYGDFSAQVCKRTSINTTGNKHSQGKEPFRKNYAGIDFTYDAEGDGFYAPQPFDSWVLNKHTFIWEPPVAYPNDKKPYTWNEETISWDLDENFDWQPPVARPSDDNNYTWNEETQQWDLIT